jgi:3-oxoacyl-[acyl-carrier-protein] synthase-1
MSSPVHVLAIGARTAIGLDAESSAAAARAGISRVRVHSFIVDKEGEGIRAAEDALLGPTVRGWRRMEAFCRHVLDEALAKLTHAAALPGRVPVLVALPESRPGFAEDDAAALLDALRRTKVPGGDALEIESAPRGHAGGLHAMQLAASRIATGRAALVLVIGADTYLTAATIDWLEQHRQIQVQGVRGGFFPGEGAGIIALASEPCRMQLGLRSMGLVAGIGTAHETKLIKTDEINLGQGLSQAIRQACQECVPARHPDAIYCDLNGERYRSEEWGLAILRLSGVLGKTNYVAPADCWGDVGAASGPLLCVLALRAWARGYAQGPDALIWAGSEAGLRGACVLRQVERP